MLSTEGKGFFSAGFWSTETVLPGSVQVLCHRCLGRWGCDQLLLMFRLTWSLRQGVISRGSLSRTGRSAWWDAQVPWHSPLSMPMGDREMERALWCLKGAEREPLGSREESFDHLPGSKPPAFPLAYQEDTACCVHIPNSQACCLDVFL